LRGGEVQRDKAMLHRKSDRFFVLVRRQFMIGNKSLMIFFAVVVALLMAFTPVAGLAHANKTYFSALECAYVLIPAQPEIRGMTMHITDQVHQTLIFSDDPTTFPNAINTAHLDITINMVTGQATVFAIAHVQPEGVEGTWEGFGTFQIDTLTGEQQGHAVMHGTGELAGQTLVINTTTGDPAACPMQPGFMSAGTWNGFIVPAER